MPYKAKISGTEKIATIEKYLRGENSLRHLANLLDVTHQSIQQWLQTYQSLGPNALLNTSKKITYSKELKTLIANDYLTGGGSHMEICKNMELNQLGRCVTGFLNIMVMRSQKLL